MSERGKAKESNLRISFALRFSSFFAIVAFGFAAADAFVLSVNVFPFDIPAGGLQGGGFPDAGLKPV